MKIHLNLFLVTILFFNFTFPSIAADLEVQGVKLFKDGNICIKNSQGTESGLDLATLQVNTDSVQVRLSSSGSFCTVPPLFTGGGILLNSSGVSTQAHPVIQSLGRGILISEMAGSTGEISSSGDPSGFSSLFSSLGGITMTIFEVQLPSGCNFTDDDDDIAGSESILTEINDFSFVTCTASNGLTVACNSEVDLLTKTNGLVQTSGNEPAKMRFVISGTSLGADGNMIDSVLIKFDAQDILCPPSVTGNLQATIIAKNAVDNPTISMTLGTISIGTASSSASVKYASETATSTKGKTSTNQIGNTALLSSGSGLNANTIEIEELDNESIPISGQTSAVLSNPPQIQTPVVENSQINIWLVPSNTSIFSTAPANSDITFSDNSLVLRSSPFIVMTNADDLNAPIGTLILPIEKNMTGTPTDPTTIKTKITIMNVGLQVASQNGTVSLSFFDPLSSAILNTPGIASIHNTNITTNPQNYSALSKSTTRAQNQNIVIGTLSAPLSDFANQLSTNNDLSLATSRNTVLNTPQIINFTNVVSQVTPIDVSKISASTTNNVISVTGNANASIAGASIKIDSISSSSGSPFDSVTIMSTNDGSFSASLEGNFSSSGVTLNFTQSIGSTNSTVSSKTVSQSTSSSSSGSLSCEDTVCGCANLNCIPTVNDVLTYITNNGGLGAVITAGGEILNEVISSAKKALGLS